MLQPIGVRPIEDNRFEIVFGERRYRASLMAGLEDIPAVVMEISDEVAEEMAVTENLQRKDVTTAFGTGRNHNQRSERNLPLWGRYSERGVQQAS